MQQVLSIIYILSITTALIMAAFTTVPKEPQAELGQFSSDPIETNQVKKDQVQIIQPKNTQLQNTQLQKTQSQTSLNELKQSNITFNKATLKSSSSSQSPINNNTRHDTYPFIS